MNRKQLIITVLALVLALTLTACNNGGNTGTPSSSPTSNPSDNDTISSGDGASETFEYGDGAGYIEDHLTGDYSISYIYSASSGDSEDSMEVKCARTSEGYYYAVSGSEILYIKNGDKYDMYYGDSENGFMKNDYMEPVSKEIVDVQMLMVTTFMTQYGVYASGMNKDGSETVAGRDCVKYSASYAGTGVEFKLTFSIDKETGVCLKYEYDAATVGQSAGMTYECTEFKTSGVTLPEYGAEN